MFWIEHVAENVGIMNTENCAWKLSAIFPPMTAIRRSSEDVVWTSIE
jgi:hypothetical protein